MMALSTRALLRALLVERYAQLRERLSTRLGSPDLAGEALNETWLKLQDGSDLAPVADPDAYLYRAAINTASNLEARRRRGLGTVAIEELAELPDEVPGPERIAMSRSEIAQVWRVLGELTPRQRHVFLESFTGSMSHEALAEEYKVSVRMIQIDLRDAILHCARRTRRKNPFARAGARVSVR